MRKRGLFNTKRIVLNSRTVVELSGGEAEQLDALTPSHILIGRPMIHKMKKDFWSRWRNEYLTALQQRNKWKQPEDNVKEGSVVLVKDENTAPANWPLTRVTEVHNGKDGKVRVVTFKIQRNTLKRPIHKPCSLLNASDEDEVSPPVKSCFTEIFGSTIKAKYWLAFLLYII